MPDLIPIPAQGTSTTLADLEARTRDLLSEETQDFYQDTTEIDRLLNEARLDIFADLEALPESWTSATVQNQASLPLPGDIARIKTVRIADKPIKEHTLPEYRELDDATGTPTGYIMVLDAGGDEQLVFWPTPDSVLAVEVDYFQYPPELTAAQGPTWHKRFHYLPCYYAAADLMDKDHLPEYGDRLRQKYEMMKQQYKAWLAERFPRHVFYADRVPKGEM